MGIFIKKLLCIIFLEKNSKFLISQNYEKNLIPTTNGEIAFIHMKNTHIYGLGCGGLWPRFIPGKLVGNQQLPLTIELFQNPQRNCWVS
jgi:hypothetical protein